MQIRLLTRTTRSVSPTAAGERLLQSVGHRIAKLRGGTRETAFPRHGDERE
jgi:DNA-binding transcriptional LysR family regulator